MDSPFIPPLALTHGTHPSFSPEVCNIVTCTFTKLHKQLVVSVISIIYHNVWSVRVLCLLLIMVAHIAYFWGIPYTQHCLLGTWLFTTWSHKLMQLLATVCCIYLSCSGRIQFKSLHAEMMYYQEVKHFSISQRHKHFV